MTDYTPITGMVRARYCDSTVRGGYADAQLLSVTPEEHEKNHAEFDRWFAEEIRKARAEGWTEGYWQGINGYTGPGNPYTLPNNTTIPYTEES